MADAVIGDGILTIGQMVVSPRWQGWRLGKELHQFLLSAMSTGAYASSSGHCLSLVLASQLGFRDLGYRMTALYLNFIPLDPNGEYPPLKTLPQKGSLVVACLPHVKRDAGTLYVPPPHAAYIAEVYESLGVGFVLKAEGKTPVTAAQTVCMISQNDLIRNCELFVREAAPDFAGILEHTLGQYGALEWQSFNAFINMNDPGCLYACRILKERGFFFTGVQPLSGQNEYILMHYSPSTPVAFETIMVIPEFKNQRAYIQDRYKETRNGQTN
jgi:hypothetical protein